MFLFWVFLGMVCTDLDKKKKNLAYKSSLRDLIFKWTLYGKYAKSDVIRTLKSSL